MLFLVCNQTVHLVTFLAIQILCVRIADVRNEAVHVGALRYLNGLVVGHEVLWLGGIVLSATLTSFCWSFIKNWLNFRLITVIHLVLLIYKAELRSLAVLNIVHLSTIVICATLRQIIQIILGSIVHWHGINERELLFKTCLTIRILIMRHGVDLHNACRLQIHWAIIAQLLALIEHLFGILRCLHVVVKEHLGPLLIFLDLA